MNGGARRRLSNLFESSLRVREADRIDDGGVRKEDSAVLRNGGEETPQLIERPITNVPPGDADVTRLDVVGPRQQLLESGLADAGLADDPDHGRRLDRHA